MLSNDPQFCSRGRAYLFASAHTSTVRILPRSPAQHQSNNVSQQSFATATTKTRQRQTLQREQKQGQKQT